MEEITELEDEAKQFVHPLYDHVFCICCAAMYLFSWDQLCGAEAHLM